VARRTLALLALIVALVAAAPAHAVDRAGLRSTLSILHDRLGPAAGAYVVDLATGEPLYEHRPDLALAPASNQKLFVTAGALLSFGPTATLDTTLAAASSAVVDPLGVLRGNLYLVGAGDPTLGDAGLRSLADQLVQQGVRRIDGGVIGDESLFDQRRGGPASVFRPDSELGGWLSALSWDHGRGAASGSPARSAATRLAALLKQRAIVYRRRPRAGHLAINGAAAVPQTLAMVSSPSIGALIADTNIPSENFYAEMLVKALGATFGQGGTTADGLGVVREQMASFGIHPRLVDGSGLSREDRTTARQVVRLLTRMDAQDVAHSWRASLPVAGVSGTLRKRMRGTAAAGQCAAKTGTLMGVSSLSGYCATAGGAQVAFSFIENRVCTACAKHLEDRMVSVIARYDG
jgi:D-alanyl-D-alanine carboxypeptidase/D-alanyl-D-alanine-endopeptidase (penicillin-binding protein 4)